MMNKNMVILVSILLITGCSEKKKHQNSIQRVATNGKEVLVYTTADSTNLRLSRTASKTFEPAEQPLETEISIFVNPEKTFQTFLGIGGAITDASAEVFARLPENKQQEFLKAYYDKEEGNAYTLARTSIHSCDFSSGSYTYVSGEEKDLTSFSIDHDKQYRIPLIKKAIEAAGGNLLLFASPWSPPAFMKDNHDMLHGGKLLPEFYHSWALYFTKFIKAYKKEGIPIWGITIQNEPMATQIWESCIYTAEEERDFLKNYLGPVMQQEGLGQLKIIIWDHNRDLMVHRVNTILEDPDAAKFVWGVGFHWYETWTGGKPMFENLHRVQESYPSKKLLFTEGTAENFRSDHYQWWPNAERYGNSMIHDFNNGTVGWTDWNILLDQTGGPNHVGNFCFAPVHANTTTGELIYTPSYYYIGHFSRFIHPGAKRISSASSRSQLITTSFLNQDGKIATIVMNQSNREINYKLYVGEATVSISILPHAIQTLVY